MTPFTDPRSLSVAFAVPTAAAALSDIVLTACQRSVSLHAQLVEQMLGLGLEQSRHAFSDPRTALRDAVLTTSAMEPVWRYTMGLAGIGRTAVTSVATLMSAQMRGADAELASLSRRARDEAAGAAIEDALEASSGSAQATQQATQREARKAERSARARTHAATKARTARSSARSAPRGKGPGKAAQQHAGAPRGGARATRGAKKAGKRG